VKSLTTARKSVEKFQEIAKKVSGDKALTRKQILVIIKRQRRGNRRWQIRGTSAHRLLSPIPTAEVENDPWESVKKLTQAHDVSSKTVHATLHKICNSQRSLPSG
jgi:hypothetical protein